MRKRLFREENLLHPDIAESYVNLGVAYERLGDDKKSLKYYKQALEMRQNLHGDNHHPDLIKSLIYVSLSYQRVGDKNNAIKHYKMAVDMK